MSKSAWIDPHPFNFSPIKGEAEEKEATETVVGGFQVETGDEEMSPPSSYLPPSRGKGMVRE